MLANENTERVYDFIRAYMAEHDYAPTLREIARGCYLARGTVLRHLDALEAADVLVRDPGKARGMRLTGREPRFQWRRKRG